MATPGTFFSAVGHTGLIVWLILGWGFSAEPLQIETMDVSVISGEEFDQMRARATPTPGDADPEAPVPPEIDDATPPPPAEEEPNQPAPPPEPVTPPQEEAPPPAPPEPLVTEAEDTPPPAPAVPQAPPPTPDVEVSPEPTPPQAPTVASEIVAPPPPDANIDDIAQDEVVPDDSAEAEVVEEEQDAAAPEEQTTAIVIEDLAPSTSVRPSARPSRPAPQPEPEPEEPETAAEEPAPSEPSTNEDDVAVALAAALGAADAPAVAEGLPMTDGERASFRVAVNKCWNVDTGSIAATVTVEVGFSLTREGTVQGNDVRLISSVGDDAAASIAFEAARRAILRCQSGGYDLPADKYEQWKDVVITFDPSGMRQR